MTHGDLDGARHTIQAIRLYHPEVADLASFVVVDSAVAGAQTAHDRVARESDAEIVCCVDSHVLVEPGGLASMLRWFDEHPDCQDRIRGRGLVACRREAWPGARVLAGPAPRTVARPDPFACFDGIFCLNLDSETGRRREAAQRHARLGISSRVERFPGVADAENTHRGIAMAYRRMIDEASRRGWEHVLVLEDDAVFLDETLPVMRTVAAELDDHEWDLCYLGACVWGRAFPALGDSAVLQECGPVTCTHAVSFHRRAYDRLLAEIPTAGPGLDRFMRDEFAIDQYLSRRIADGTYRAIITSPRVASQPNLLEFDDADAALAARYVI